MSDQPTPGAPPERHRITQVYTRTGDRGQTRLVGGQTVSKDHPRLEAYGTVDELQAFIGQARDALAATLTELPAGENGRLALIRGHLAYMQNLLFTVGGDLATRLEDRWDGMPLVGEAQIDYLERLIDSLNASLQPLKDFVLPGGHPAVTALHLCRVVCRRAERAVERLGREEAIGEAVRPFLNRFSDALFVLSRAVSQELAKLGHAEGETIWQRDVPEPPMPK